jgi:hypothetical protein
MLVNGGKISGSGYTLIIQTTPSNINQLRKLIKSIDTKPAMFKIMLKNVVDVNNSDYLVKHYSTRNMNNSIQSITTLSGHGAFISQGKDQSVVSIIGGSFWPSVLRTYKKRQTGFYIVPYLRGSQVMLKIIYKDENSQDPQSEIELQNMATTVIVPLGRWTNLGGQATNNSSSSEYTSTYSTGSSSNIAIQIIKIPN